MAAPADQNPSLSEFRPPRLEDAGLEDCALPPDSIREAFLKAAAAVGARFDDDHDEVDDCIDPASHPAADEKENGSGDGSGDRA
uniref:Uncharacterized protein n=1 Tax=Kalanchoe fedtschenkoi TaxID=63787 RepID=A0A7N0TC49_KALFE